MEENAQGLYLIEEYIQGENLYDRIKNLGSMRTKEVIKIALELCEILEYLHNQEIPILHLDIQPANLILKDKSINLIDFDHSKTSSKTNTDGYGTYGFAAPEVFNNSVVDVRTDIYSLGAVMYFTLTGEFLKSKNIKLPESVGELAEVISLCLSSDKEERYESISSLKEALTKLSLEVSDDLNRIGIVSTARGSGTTFISMALANFLKNKKLTVVLHEKNLSAQMINLALNEKLKFDNYGYFKYKGIMISPEHSKEIELKQHDAGIYIEDYGDELEKALFESPDILILVCRSESWHTKENYLAISKIYSSIKVKRFKKVFVVYNLYKENTKIKLPSLVDKKDCFKFPYLENLKTSKIALFETIYNYFVMGLN